MLNIHHSPLTEPDDTDWLPVSDMMSGLMMVFLFIAVVVIKSTQLDPEEPATEPPSVDIVIPEMTLQEQIYNQLNKEFEQDLRKWRASIDEHNLTLSFHKSNGMFDSGLADLNTRYSMIFSEFYPRYLRSIAPFADHIHEIRVEGHTSSDWKNAKSDFEAYINNLSLSQRRALTVLKQLSQFDNESTTTAMLFSKFTSIGYASAQPVFDNQGNEDPQASRRVAFRIVLPSQNMIPTFTK